MRRIAIIGAGESGVQLALGLQRHGYQVSLFSDRTPDQVREGSVMSSQVLFSPALAAEEKMDISPVTEADPTDAALQISGIELNLPGDRPVSWRGSLESPARSVDQRVKCSVWMESFRDRGGDLQIEAVTVGRLEELSRGYDLVVVSTGKGELGQIFRTDKTKSPYDRPQRVLGLAYVKPLDAQGDPAVRMSIKPGVGEFFTFPGITTTGACRMMVFEGLPGGPMDSWVGVRSPQEHLEHSLQLLREHFPAEAKRFEGAELTDGGATLRGRITPTVRRPVGTLPSGRQVLGMGDAIVLNDPVTGQGSNNAALAASYYEDAILRHGGGPFDATWMQRTFDEFWRGWAQWSVSWTNSMLRPLRDHQLELFSEAAEHPAVADALARGFEDPRTLFPWWQDAQDAQDFLDSRRHPGGAAPDPRAFRNALGQFATGVTVVTTRGADGRRTGLTANSFTSVSMDPPLVLWCPSRNAPSLADFNAASHFAINILAEDQKEISQQFARPAEDKFAGVGTSDGRNGVPVIDDAAATFECRTVARHEAGDHVIYVGEVEHYSANGGRPLVFHAGKYRSVAEHPEA
ncbi:flavin reductase [Arthrobacter sp. GCM10027362]|uniref:flavin reductase n=1 Tax=Arthrobacter sp. GCM10027362 TaxID=3273379 RepID=UPI00363E475C